MNGKQKLINQWKVNNKYDFHIKALQSSLSHDRIVCVNKGKKNQMKI